MMRLGFRKPLTLEDLWDINKTDDAHEISLDFQERWTREQSTKEK